MLYTIRQLICTFEIFENRSDLPVPRSQKHVSGELILLQFLRDCHGAFTLCFTFQNALRNAIIYLIVCANM